MPSLDHTTSLASSECTDIKDVGQKTGQSVNRLFSLDNIQIIELCVINVPDRQDRAKIWDMLKLRRY